LDQMWVPGGKVPQNFVIVARKKVVTKIKQPCSPNSFRCYHLTWTTAHLFQN